MKHLILFSLIILEVNYIAIILSKKIDDGFEVEGRRTKCRSSGGRCHRRTESCDDGFEVIWKGRPYCRRKHNCCAPAPIFIGPYSNVWNDECRSIGSYLARSLSDCKLLCIQTWDCTAINLWGNWSTCELKACPWPVPLPQGNYPPPYQGYAIATACGTDSKCGIRGGFCIPQNEECNGNFISGEGYCNANFRKTSCKCCFSPTVYMRDIENTIAYALRNRAPYNSRGPPPAPGSEYRTLNSSQQQALANFAQVLVRHLLLRPSLVRFLNCLSRNLPMSNGQDIYGEELLNDTYIGCGSKTDLPYVREWVGCKNTDNIRIQRFRSYPCGVWTTFHAITVNLTQGVQENFPRILPTLYGMVDFFPWCPDCRAHFIDMYNNLNASAMNTADEVSLWLWRAHNKVSVRVEDGFDVKNRTLIASNCKSYTPHPRLQTLESACKFECKVKKKVMKDCKYITLPSDDNNNTCQICRGNPEDTPSSAYVMYVLNTAPENPGRRKSLFPEFKLCNDCWILVANYNEPKEFTTSTNEAAVLSYLRKIYSADAIVPDNSV